MSITKENPNPVPRAPTEPKGVTVESSSAPAALASNAEPAPAPRMRGFAPPIIDTLPSTPAETAAPAGPVKLPKLWLAFHSDGKRLYCTGALQRDQVQRLQFDPSDPIIAQAYTYFVKQMVRLLDGGTPAQQPASPEPAQAEAPTEQAPAEPVDPKTVPLAELKTRRETEPPPHRSLRSSQVQRLEQKPAEQKPAEQKPAEQKPAEDDVVPPTNPNPDRVK
jgi:hypothetical protein